MILRFLARLFGRRIELYEIFRGVEKPGFMDADPQSPESLRQAFKREAPKYLILEDMKHAVIAVRPSRFVSCPDLHEQPEMLARDVEKWRLWSRRYGQRVF